MAQVTQQGRGLFPFTKRSREEVVASLKQDAAVWRGFIRLSEVLQEELLGFAMGERAACYSSDLMMRQYTRVKEQKKDAFSYQDIQNVYTIVLIEKSTSEFHEIPFTYIHRNRDGFDTGLRLNLPQKFIFIPLDVFHKITYTVDRNIECELVAWLLFLSSDKPEDIVRIIDAYPFFAEMYEEMAQFQRKPEELVGMYSEALEIMDRNTVRYMMEEDKKEIERLRLEGEELRRKNEERERQCQESDRQRQESDRQRQESDRRCREMDAENERLRQLLSQKE